MSEGVKPVLVRVPEELAERLREQAEAEHRSRHAVILDKLAHECEQEQQR